MNEPTEQTPTAEPLLPAPGSQPAEPLKAVEWQFPLGSCVARLTIVATEPGEIVPEDMDALREIAGLMKRQLLRRRGEAENTKL